MAFADVSHYNKVADRTACRSLLEHGIRFLVSVPGHFMHARSFDPVEDLKLDTSYWISFGLGPLLQDWRETKDAVPCGRGSEAS